MDHDFTSSTFDDEPFQQHETLATSANFACPACQSRRTIPRDTGKKAGAAIGTVAGAAGGISGALSGAVTGTEIGMAMAAAVTATTPFGIVAGAVLGALSGGIAGCRSTSKPLLFNRSQAEHHGQSHTIGSRAHARIRQFMPPGEAPGATASRNHRTRSLWPDAHLAALTCTDQAPGDVAALPVKSATEEAGP